mmetsp:Transcript_12650/g.23831  ORF Transcript_12650/g.23831 Transcript_12650/m.23831 type:complete len:115 (+) Transcript_12650:89-433(+)
MLRLSGVLRASVQTARRCISTWPGVDNLDRCYCLEVFGCKDAPSKGELRARYIALAKQLHPDAAHQKGRPQTSEAFQTLHSCYKLLMQEHDKKNEPEWLRKLREDYATSKDPFP